jgi:hypothetical protein
MLAQFDTVIGVGDEAREALPVVELSIPLGVIATCMT